MNCRIGIRNLATGEHQFDFKLDGSFFESYESDLISDADLDVKATVTKGSGHMGMLLEIDGNVTVKCDRCLADLVIPVSIESPFTIVFSSYSEDADEESDEVIVMDGGATEIELSQMIYDYVNLALPLKKVHEEGECDPEMMEKLKGILK